MAPTKEKTKRKRVEIDADNISAEKPFVHKPSKKLRKETKGSTSPQNTEKQIMGRKDLKVADLTGREEVEKRLEITTAKGRGTSDSNAKTRSQSQGFPNKARTKAVLEGSEVAAAEREEIHLEGFSSESDSSDEDLDDIMDAPPLNISTLPIFSNDDAGQRLEMAKRQQTEHRGVIYVGRLPHGFYEDQMRAYFSQFGNVTRVRLSRNKKTGRSKHYAFVEFSSSAVAEIVGETMNNYLLLGHILQCKVIPKDQVHPELWVGADKKWRFVPRGRVARSKQNKPRTREEQQRTESKLIARQKKKQARILASGIQYDFQDVAYISKAECLC